MIGFLRVLDGPALFAREAVALLVIETGLELGALFGDAGLDAVDVVADVDAIGDRLDVRVGGSRPDLKQNRG